MSARKHIEATTTSSKPRVRVKTVKHTTARDKSAAAARKLRHHKRRRLTAAQVTNR